MIMNGPSRRIKFTAWLVLILFSSSDFIAAAPAALPLVSETGGWDARIHSLQIPENWGRIEGRFLPSRKAAEPSVSVIYIQDAHAQPDAQRKIQVLLEHFTENKLADEIFVEGAAGKLSPRALEIFEDARLNLAIGEYLLQSGELTGTELYVLKHRKSGLSVYGAEDVDLYRTSYERFRQVKKEKAAVEKILAVYKKTLEQLQIESLPSELQSYLIRKMHWQSGGEDMARYLSVLRPLTVKYLGLDFTDTRLQFDWPSLTRFAALESREAFARDEQAFMEAGTLAEELEKKAKQSPAAGKLAKKLREIFSRNAQSPAFVEDEAFPGISSYRSFFELLRKETKNLKIELLSYPVFVEAAGILSLREEIDGTLLFEEIGRLETMLEAKLINNAKEEELVALIKDFVLIEKLLGLSLTRREYSEYLDKRDTLRPDTYQKRLNAFLPETLKREASLPALPGEVWSRAEEFYILSEKRDEEILENVLAGGEKGLKARTGKVKVLIAGGFHSEGIENLLKEKAVPHVIISPKITHLEERGLYEKVMMGTSSRHSSYGTNLVKVILSQISETYKAMHPDGSSNEQAALIYEALYEAAVPLLRESGLSNKEIYELLMQETAASPVFQGVRPGIDYIDEEDRIVFGVWNEQGKIEETVPAVSPAGRIRADLPQSAAPHFTRFKHAAARAAAAGGPGLSAGFVTGSRSELRKNVLELEPIKELLLMGPSESAELERVRAAIREVTEIKQTVIDRAPAGGQNPLLSSRYAETLQGPSRPVTTIEAIARLVAFENRRIETLPLPYRAAFALAAFDPDHFPRVHNRLRDIIDEVQMKNHFYNDYLTFEEYARLTEAFSSAEHEDTITENVLLRFALNWLIFDIPRIERRALEKENLVNELIKERQKPGSGDITPQAFLTDLHGSTKVGTFIAHLLQIGNYQGITSPEELEARLIEDWKIKNPDKPVPPLRVMIEERKANIVGGSDYVDRGPKPYWGYRFNKWLRGYGLLDFISGNHDQWKDENILGFHLLVHDTFRSIANSARIRDSDIEQHLPQIKKWVTTVNWDAQKDAEKFEELDNKLRSVLKRYLEIVREAGGVPDPETIEMYADEVIDAGTNPNHALVWWAREWGIHGGWFDTFLDQINEELLNKYIDRINHAVKESGRNRYVAQMAAFLAGAMGDINSYDEIEREAFGEILDNLRQSGTLLNHITTENFLEQSDVELLKARVESIVGPFDADFLAGIEKLTPKKQAEALIKVIKDKNAAIRSANEAFAAKKEFHHMRPQYKVPSAFEYAAKGAERRYRRILEIVSRLNSLFPGINLPQEQIEVVTYDNYRSNPTVTETVLWDLQNFKLIYTDLLGNFYSHGIIPFDPETKDFRVEYATRDGVVLKGIAAIERIQLDVREFFEKYENIPDTPEFRELLYREVGPAFEVLNEWYSDVLAYLKPPEIEKFVNTGGPGGYPIAFASALAPREFTGDKGVMHVGHVEAGKLRKQQIPYWVGAMQGGLLHGDYEMSEGYAALGAMIVWFGRDKDGRLQGMRRLGYRETIPSLTKKIEELKKKIKPLEDKLSAEPKEGEEPIDAAAVRGDIEKLKRQMEPLISRREYLQEHGEQIEDITFADDISPEEAEKIRPFTDGETLADYYIVRFLEENIEAYAKLQKETILHGRGNRAGFYQRREMEMREKLADYLELREKMKSESGRSELRADSQAKKRNPVTPGVQVDGRRVSVNLKRTVSVDDVLRALNLKPSEIDTIHIVGGPNDIPVYAADAANERWGSSVDLDRRLLAIKTKKSSFPRSELRALHDGREVAHMYQNDFEAMLEGAKVNEPKMQSIIPALSVLLSIENYVRLNTESIRPEEYGPFIFDTLDRYFIAKLPAAIRDALREGLRLEQGKETRGGSRRRQHWKIVYYNRGGQGFLFAAPEIGIRGGTPKAGLKNFAIAQAILEIYSLNPETADSSVEEGPLSAHDLLIRILALYNRIQSGVPSDDETLQAAILLGRLANKGSEALDAILGSGGRARYVAEYLEGDEAADLVLPNLITIILEIALADSAAVPDMKTAKRILEVFKQFETRGPKSLTAIEEGLRLLNEKMGPEKEETEFTAGEVLIDGYLFLRLQRGVQKIGDILARIDIYFKQIESVALVGPEGRVIVNPEADGHFGDQTVDFERYSLAIQLLDGPRSELRTTSPQGILSDEGNRPSSELRTDSNESEPSERIETRRLDPGEGISLIDQMNNLFRGAGAVLESYEDRRWVAVHITHGIFAVLSPELPSEARAKAVEFLKRDLFYFDYVPETGPLGAFFGGTDGAWISRPGLAQESTPGIQISVIPEISETPADVHSHFLGIAHALQNQPGHIYEFILDGNPEDAARLEQLFRDEYRYAGFAGRYHLEAVSRGRISGRVRTVVEEAFNALQGAGFKTLREFTGNVSFSSTDKEILMESLAGAGWLIFNDLDFHPGVQSYLNERALLLSSRRLEAELLRNLGEVLRVNSFISARDGLLSDVSLVSLRALWEKYSRSLLIGRSA